MPIPSFQLGLTNPPPSGNALPRKRKFDEVSSFEPKYDPNAYALVRVLASAPWPDPTHGHHSLPAIVSPLHGVARARICAARVDVREAWQALEATAGGPSKPALWQVLRAALVTLAQQGTPEDLFAAAADFSYFAERYLAALTRAMRSHKSLRLFGELQADFTACADIIERSPQRSRPALEALTRLNRRACDSMLALIEDASLWPLPSAELPRRQGERRALLDRIDRWDSEAKRLGRALATPIGLGLLPCVPSDVDGHGHGTQVFLPQSTVAQSVADERSSEAGEAISDGFAEDSDGAGPPLSLRERMQASQAYCELEAMIGLSSVKHHLKLLVSQVSLAHIEGRSHGTPSLHLLFGGNPGTGKTTVARLFARILKDLDLLAQGHVIEASRADLVGEFLGQSEKRTSDKIEAARGGVLFIDEAHQLVRKGGHHDYGMDVIHTLVPAMENMRQELVVIFACYANEKDSFLRLDSGLTDRISNHITFPDYDNAELARVLCAMAQARRYALSPELAERVSQSLGRGRGKHGFGNARLVRRTLDAAIAQRAQRIIDAHRDAWFDRDEDGCNLLREADFCCLQSQADNFNADATS